MQYPRGTTSVYSNLTPRSVYGGETEERPGYVVMFGLRHFLLQLQRDYQAFFDCDIDVVARSFAERFEAFTGLDDVCTGRRDVCALDFSPRINPGNS